MMMKMIQTLKYGVYTYVKFLFYEIKQTFFILLFLKQSIDGMRENTGTCLTSQVLDDDDKLDDWKDDDPDAQHDPNSVINL